jgi:predicted transcriptional regulator
MTRSEDINALLAPTAMEYDAEEHAAGEQEVREAEADTSSLVFSVRLSPDVYASVRAAASRAHLTPSALLRQWVSERVELGPNEDRGAVVAALRRDVDRVARLLGDRA